MAIASSKPSPESDDWKACALPWNVVVVVGGRACLARSLISATASPIEVPGLRLKEIVTAGNCPRWFTERGPSVGLSFATALMGTSWPVEFEKFCELDGE